MKKIMIAFIIICLASLNVIQAKGGGHGGHGGGHHGGGHHGGGHHHSGGHHAHGHHGGHGHHGHHDRHGHGWRHGAGYGRHGYGFWGGAFWPGYFGGAYGLYWAGSWLPWNNFCNTYAARWGWGINACINYNPDVDVLPAEVAQAINNEVPADNYID